MLADVSISWADVSKAKPRAAQPAIGHTHAGWWPRRGPASRGIGAANWLQKATAEEEGRPGSPPRRD
jgi:hypothetical protein